MGTRIVQSATCARNPTRSSASIRNIYIYREREREREESGDVYSLCGRSLYTIQTCGYCSRTGFLELVSNLHKKLSKMIVPLLIAPAAPIAVFRRSLDEHRVPSGKKQVSQARVGRKLAAKRPAHSVKLVEIPGHHNEKNSCALANSLFLPLHFKKTKHAHTRVVNKSNRTRTWKPVLSGFFENSCLYLMPLLGTPPA